MPPTPLSFTVCGLPAASSSIDRVPVSLLVVFSGQNLTEKVQVLIGAISVLMQPDASNSGLSMSIRPIFIGTGLLLLSLIDFGGEGSKPTRTLPKLSVLGRIPILPNLPTPRTRIPTIGLVALLFTVRLPLRTPA